MNKRGEFRYKYLSDIKMKELLEEYNIKVTKINSITTYFDDSIKLLFEVFINNGSEVFINVYEEELENGRT